MPLASPSTSASRVWHWRVGWFDHEGVDAAITNPTDLSGPRPWLSAGDDMKARRTQPRPLPPDSTAQARGAEGGAPRHLSSTPPSSSLCRGRRWPPCRRPAKAPGNLQQAPTPQHAQSQNARSQLSRAAPVASRRAQEPVQSRTIQRHALPSCAIPTGACQGRETNGMTTAPSASMIAWSGALRSAPPQTSRPSPVVR